MLSPVRKSRGNDRICGDERKMGEYPVVLLTRTGIRGKWHVNHFCDRARLPEIALITYLLPNKALPRLSLFAYALIAT